LDVQTPQEDWENFLRGVNGFLIKKRQIWETVVFRQCFAPVLIVSTKRSLHNGKSFFIIWSHVVEQKIACVGINMMRKALMNSKQAA
jgi:hypothetical protein